MRPACGELRGRPACGELRVRPACGELRVRPACEAVWRVVRVKPAPRRESSVRGLTLSRTLVFVFVVQQACFQRCQKTWFGLV